MVGRGEPRAYARAAALRLLYRIHGKARLEQSAAARAAMPENPGELFERDAERVVRMLHALASSQREVIALVMDGYEPTEIADITGQNPATVRSNLRHARQNLIRMIAQNAEATRKEATHGS